MALQINGDYPNIDLHPNRVEQYNKLERCMQENANMYRENEDLQCRLLQANEKISQLQYRNEIQERQLLQYRKENYQLHQQFSQLQQQLNQAEQHIEFLDKNLKNQENLVDQLNEILDKSHSIMRFSKANTVTNKCTIQQENTKMENLEELGKLRCLQTEADNVSAAPQHLKMKTVAVVDTSHLADMLDNKLLVYDTNDNNEQTCDLGRRTARKDKLDSITVGRFEIDRKLTECLQCHQVFDSLAEMEASTCIFHPTNSSPTGTPGKYFWKCCQAEAAKSCRGCQSGKHIQAIQD